MLDNATKRRIDNARQILVGKVPDPKAQVEQITTALIYKFMDDMDQESVELGGKATFFTGEYAQFSWGKLMDKRLGGAARMDLYVRAISKMSENPHLPQLFRTIFKGTFLPYRDFETLNLFLKEINGFVYDHSERLGDAYEYLLSVLGSQGKVGQFRTPRHIIDFIVETIAPSKRETVLDPACGTAGFLISAYKHILRQNADTPLTPAERERLTSNFVGYDISPDMVRLSLVNMYLHQFPNPTIVEYDTLTSDARWDDGFDVILANPPFMTPKGGIRPHNRFSITASRSELLFVDYIAEHLHKDGRAGIIVPEGIIFQSGKAYKKLRKMLVEEGYLVGVVSLPAGVFQPYSGVKTSVLLLDRRLAKGTDGVLFVNVTHDGFGTGAQRRPTAENDLPAALRLIQQFQTGPRAALEPTELAHVVAKSAIAADGDYNLSGGRYREAMDYSNVEWPLVELGDVTEVIAGQSPAGKYYNETGEGMPFYQGKTKFTEMYLGSPRKWTTKVTKIADEGDVLMSVRAPVGPVNLATQQICIGRGLAAIRPDKSKAMAGYLFYLLKAHQDNIKGNSGSTFASINKKDIQAIKIPLPPLAVQEAIVAEIEGYQQVMDGARQVLTHYKPHITVDPEWTAVALEEICGNFKNGVNFSKEQVGSGTKFVNVKDLFSDGFVNNDNLKAVELSPREIARYSLNNNDLLFVRSSVKYEGVGYPSLVKIEGESIVFAGFIIKCSPNPAIVVPKYLLFLLRTQVFREKVVSISNRVSITNISQGSLKALQIPLPPLETQHAIVAAIEAEQALVAGNKRLVALFEAKIAQTIARVWGA